jgi:hypothetical protein
MGRVQTANISNAVSSSIPSIFASTRTSNAISVCRLKSLCFTLALSYSIDIHHPSTLASRPCSFSSSSDRYDCVADVVASEEAA